jgi:hypothetical protein
MTLENNNQITSSITSPPTKKSYRHLKPLIIISSLTVGLSLSSCVDPSYQQYGSNYQRSSYNSGYSPGYRTTSLPSGYRTEYISGRTYHYHNGQYYQPNSGGYMVVEAPRTSRYYTEYSRYRQPSSTDHRNRDGSYNHTDHRRDGAQIITRLPSGYREINHRGITYYKSGDRYYTRRANGYIVVQRPY